MIPKNWIKAEEIGKEFCNIGDMTFTEAKQQLEDGERIPELWEICYAMTKLKEELDIILYKDFFYLDSTNNMRACCLLNYRDFDALGRHLNNFDSAVRGVILVREIRK